MDYVQPPPTTSYKTFKIIVILSIIGFFIYEFQDVIRFFISLGSIMKQFVGIMGNSYTPIEEPTKILKPKSKSIVSKTMDSLTPKPKYKPIPQPDTTTSTIQSNVNGKHCYIGEWKGIRSCYEINNPNECTSGQLYETADKCQHPELR